MTHRCHNCDKDIPSDVRFFAIKYGSREASEEYSMRLCEPCQRRLLPAIPDLIRQLRGTYQEPKRPFS